MKRFDVKNIKITGKGVVAIAMLGIIFIAMWGYLSWVQYIDRVLAYVIGDSEAVQAVDAADDSNGVIIYDSYGTDVNGMAAVIDSSKLAVITYRVNSVLKLIDSFKSVLENRFNEDVLYHSNMIELNTAFQYSLGKVVISDSAYDVVKLENNYLELLRDEYDVTDNADKLIELSDYLNGKGVDLLYIQAPFKINKYDDQLPYGVNDYTNINVDNLLVAIDGEVEYIDLRELIYEQGLDHYSLFYKTDHHWTSQAGFWAFGEIVQVLNSDYGFDYLEEYWDISNYTVETYEDWFLGTQGKRVGQYAVGVDDFSLITPNFDTEFTFEVENNDIYREGSFYDTMYDFSTLNEIDYYNLSPYLSYIGGDYSLNIIDNLLIEDGKKILLIKDSFSVVVSPYLALGCDQLDIIDLRSYNEGSLVEYIDETSPDLVMFLYNPSMINSESCWGFFE